MDLVKYVRSKRMHSYALTFLTNQRERVLSSMLAHSKRLETGPDSLIAPECNADVKIYTQSDTLSDVWICNENMNAGNKFFVGLLKRYGRYR